MKKASGDVIILNMCNKNTIIWCTLTQVWSVTDIIFCHFRPFFPLLPHYWPRKLKFGKNVKKKKKTPADIILLHTCTIDQDHMMYGSWDMKCNRQEFLSSWAIFCPFTSPLHSLIAWKKKISKTKKNPGDIIILHKCSKNHNHLLYCSRDMVHDRCLQLQLLFFILGYLLPFYPPNSSKNENFQKMKKTPGDIIILHKCTINYD